MNNYVVQLIKKQSTMRIVLAAVVLAIVIAGLLANIRYLKAYFGGPTPVTAAELSAARSPEQLKSGWIEFKVERVLDTGLVVETVRKKRGRETGRSTTGHYYVGDLGNGKYIVINSIDGKPEGTVKGYLKELDPRVSGRLAPEYTGETKRSFSEDFLPLSVETKDYKSDGDIGLGIALILGVGALIYGGIAFMRMQKPQGHSAYKRISTVGDPDQVAQRVKTELESSAGIKMGAYTFTPNFVAQRAVLNFDLHLLDELVWAYLEVTQNKYMYVIPLGKTFVLKLHWKDKAVDIKGNEARTREALDYIEQHAPWVILGYTDELKSAWDKSKTSVIKAVQERKREIAMQGRSNPEGATEAQNV